MEFREQNWKSLEVKGKYYDEPDEGRRSCMGLFVRVYPTGVKSWILRYYPEYKGKQRTVTLARCDRLSPTDARAKAEKIKGGADPHPTPEAVHTVGGLLDRFVQDKFEALRKSTADEYIRLFKTKVLCWQLGGKGKKLEEWDLKRVRGEHAAALLKDCRETAPRSSTIICVKLHEAWEYAMTLEWLPQSRNIWSGQVKPRITKRKRRLKDEELVALGQRLKTHKEKPELVIGILLYLLTGSRHSNVVHARWEWVDLEQQIIRVPQAEHKTGDEIQEDLDILLSTQAVEFLRKLKEIQETKRKGIYAGSPWLFPARGDKDKHRDDLQDPWERIRAGQSYEDVHIHDLRRTLTSVISDQGHKQYSDEILGHKERTVGDIYNRTSNDVLLKYLQEATDKITGLLEGTVKPSVREIQPTTVDVMESQTATEQIGTLDADRSSSVKAGEATPGGQPKNEQTVPEDSEAVKRPIRSFNLKNAVKVTVETIENPFKDVSSD